MNSLIDGLKNRMLIFQEQITKLEDILQKKKLESMKEKLSNIKDGSPGLLREVLEAVN